MYRFLLPSHSKLCAGVRQLVITRQIESCWLLRLHHHHQSPLDLPPRVLPILLPHILGITHSIFIVLDLPVITNFLTGESFIEESLKRPKKPSIEIFSPAPFSFWIVFVWSFLFCDCALLLSVGSQWLNLNKHWFLKASLIMTGTIISFVQPSIQCLKMRLISQL